MNSISNILLLVEFWQKLKKKNERCQWQIKDRLCNIEMLQGRVDLSYHVFFYSSKFKYYFSSFNGMSFSSFHLGIGCKENQQNQTDQFVSLIRWCSINLSWFWVQLYLFQFFIWSSCFIFATWNQPTNINIFFIQ